MTISDKTFGHYYKIVDTSTFDDWTYNAATTSGLVTPTITSGVINVGRQYYFQQTKYKTTRNCNIFVTLQSTTSTSLEFGLWDQSANAWSGVRYTVNSSGTVTFTSGTSSSIVSTFTTPDTFDITQSLHLKFEITDGNLTLKDITNNVEYDCGSISTGLVFYCRKWSSGNMYISASSFQVTCDGNNGSADLTSLDEWAYYKDYSSGKAPSSDGTYIYSGTYHSTYWTPYPSTQNCTYNITLQTSQNNRFQWGFYDPTNNRTAGILFWKDTGNYYAKTVDSNGNETIISTDTVVPTTETTYIISITDGNCIVKDTTNNKIYDMGTIITGYYIYVRKWSGGNITVSNLTFQATNCLGKNTEVLSTDSNGGYSTKYINTSSGQKILSSQYDGNTHDMPALVTDNCTPTVTDVSLQFPNVGVYSGEECTIKAYLYDSDGNPLPACFGRSVLKIGGVSFTDDDGNIINYTPVDGVISDTYTYTGSAAYQQYELTCKYNGLDYYGTPEATATLVTYIDKTSFNYYYFAPSKQSAEWTNMYGNNTITMSSSKVVISKPDTGGGFTYFIRPMPSNMLITELYLTYSISCLDDITGNIGVCDMTYLESHGKKGLAVFCNFKDDGTVNVYTKKDGTSTLSTTWDYTYSSATQCIMEISQGSSTVFSFAIMISADSFYKNTSVTIDEDPDDLYLIVNPKAGTSYTITSLRGSFTEQ